MVVLKNLSDYGKNFQSKVIYSLLKSPKFLRNVYDLLDYEDFDNQSHKWVVQNILKYYEKYSAPPTLEVLKVEYQKVENDVLKASIKENLREIFAFSGSGDLDYIENTFFEFCTNQKLKNALLESVDLLKTGEYEVIRNKIDNALKSGQKQDIGHNYKEETENRYRDNRDIIPTPWGDINDLLQGGLGNGDLGIIFGNPGGGKSWMLVELGAYAVKMGYNVLHFTLELSEKYVGRRYDAHFPEIPVTQVKNHQDKIEEILKGLKGNLIIKEFPPKRANINTLEIYYQKCIDINLKPDLILVDYLDLLSNLDKSIKDKKEKIDDVYIDAKGLAKELDIPMWSVSQVNRAGAQDDVIEGDKAAGSYDKLMIADFLGSLSRKRKDKVEGTGRFHIMKNRYGIDGITFGVNTDLSIGKFKFCEFNEEEYYKQQQQQQQQQNNKVTNREKQTLKEKYFDFINEDES